MSLMLKLFSIVDAYATPKLIGFCKYVEVNTYAKLMPLPEGIHIVDWPFQFFYIESRCMINYKFEELNTYFLM